LAYAACDIFMMDTLWLTQQQAIVAYGSFIVLEMFSTDVHRRHALSKSLACNLRHWDDFFSQFEEFVPLGRSESRVFSVGIKWLKYAYYLVVHKNLELYAQYPQGFDSELQQQILRKQVCWWFVFMIFLRHGLPGLRLVDMRDIMMVSTMAEFQNLLLHAKNSKADYCSLISIFDPTATELKKNWLQSFISPQKKRSRQTEDITAIFLQFSRSKAADNIGANMFCPIIVDILANDDDVGTIHNTPPSGPTHRTPGEKDSQPWDITSF
jgi:hypothetical protein